MCAEDELDEMLQDADTDEDGPSAQGWQLHVNG